MVSKITKHNDGSVSVSLNLANIEPDHLKNFLGDLRNGMIEHSRPRRQNANAWLRTNEDIEVPARGRDGVTRRRYGFSKHHDEMQENAAWNAAGHTSDANSMSEQIERLIGALEATAAYGKAVTLHQTKDGYAYFTFGKGDKEINFSTDNRSVNTAVSETVKYAVEKNFQQLYKQLGRALDTSLERDGKH